MKKMNKKTKINIFIENEYKAFSEKIDITQLTEKTCKMLEFFLSQKNYLEKSCIFEYDYKLLCFDIVLCDNEMIHRINKEYRDKDCPTDVITFAIFSDSPKEERFIFDNEINLGEIIISLDKTKEQFKNEKHMNNSFMQELYFLLAHGILHLMGYDHQTEDLLQEMWNIQQEMINGANINV